jgi:phosphate-selective porin OprO/OprP
MRIHTRAIRTVLAASSLLAALPALRAQSNDSEIQALRAQIEQLDQKLRVLERKEEIKSDDAAAAAKAAPQVNISDKGLTIASGDGANSFHIGGLVQLDSREFFGDSGTVAGPSVINNSFVLRRARLISDGTFGKIYSFQLVTEFGGGSNSGGASTASGVSILDANLNIAPTKAVQFKFGKFKAPVGLEYLQADAALLFVERSLVNNLVPQRDLGAQVWGLINNGVVAYSAGVYGGLGDLVNSGNVDFDNDKDGIVRIFAQPFTNDKDSVVQGLGFGAAASYGRDRGVASSTTTGVATGGALTGGYKTDGQQTFFKYGTAVNDGATWRVSPQAYYYYGPISLLGEYAVSAVNVRNQAAVTNPPTKPAVELINRAWEIQGGYVLTGEKSTFAGVSPSSPFSWDKGTWGAWQVGVRYAKQTIDDNTFPTFAATTTNAKAAAAIGAGLNWYLSNTVKISTDYFQTKFTLPNGVASSATEILNHDEKSLITRFQIAF